MAAAAAKMGRSGGMGQMASLRQNAGEKGRDGSRCPQDASQERGAGGGKGAVRTKCVQAAA